MTLLATDNIEATAATQVRTKIHKDVVDMYQHDIENGAVMPPVVVFAENGSERFILADGFHRIVAHVNAGFEKIECDVREGNMHDALAYALSANQQHGLRRSNADKVNAVKLALKDPEFSQRTQQEIADLCGVHINTVQRTSVKDTKPVNTPKVVKPTADDHRPTMPEPTQEEIELGELRGALSVIKAFPYPGDQATKLGLSKDDVADLEYVSSWAAHAVFAARSEQDVGP